jgi:hypothetical protein
MRVVDILGVQIGVFELGELGSFASRPNSIIAARAALYFNIYPITLIRESLTVRTARVFFSCPAVQGQETDFDHFQALPTNALTTRSIIGRLSWKLGGLRYI